MIKFREFQPFCKFFRIGGTMFHCQLGVDDGGPLSNEPCDEEHCLLIRDNRNPFYMRKLERCELCVAWSVCKGVKRGDYDCQKVQQELAIRQKFIKDEKRRKAYLKIKKRK